MKNSVRLLFILTFSFSIQAKAFKWTDNNNFNLSKNNNIDSTITYRNSQILGPPYFSINEIFIDTLNNKYVATSAIDIHGLNGFENYFGIIKLDTTFSNIYSFHDSKVKYLNKNSIQKIEHYNCSIINSFTIDKSSNIWIGTNDGIIKLENGIQLYYSTKNGLIDNYITQIITDNNNNIWVATPKGISKFNGETWVSYTTQNGLVNNNITTLTSDMKNNIWIGTIAGISKFDGVSWINYNTNDGLINNYITAIGVDKNGDMWFGAKNKGSVTKFDGKNWSNLIIDEINKSDIIDIKIDNKGNKWFISFGSYANIVKYDGHILTKYSNEKDIDFSNIKSFAIDSKDNLWVGILNDERFFNILQYDGVKWKKIIIPDKFYTIKK